MAPFLSVMTRHLPRRGALLDRCRESLEAQTSRDYEHIVLTDDVGVGVGESHLELADNAHRCRGEYIYVLDDDDMLICPHFVDCMRGIGETERPAVIMVRMNYAGASLPAWRQQPREGRISTQNFVVRRDVFVAHRHAWSTRYQADYDFINDVWQGDPVVHWHDCVAVTDQRGRAQGRD